MSGSRRAEVDPGGIRIAWRRALRGRALSRADAPVLLLGAAAFLTAGSCGGGGSAMRVQTGSSAPAAAANATPKIPTLHVAAAARLPAPVQLPAVAAGANGAFAIGGLDAGDASVADVVLIDGAGAREATQLPLALHDAAAAQIGGQTYMFGGGEPSGTSESIFRITASGVRTVGHLPVGSSDIEAATIAHTAYVVGGYTLSAPLRTIVAFTPGGRARSVAMLPRPLRYAAVAAVGGRMLIAGGTSGETAERAILSFDPATHTVRQIGELPEALTHAAGASLNGWFYVIGGRGESLTDQRSSILAVDPRSGAVRPAGHLPEALSDMGAASLAGHILAVGGRNPAGRVYDQALTLIPTTR